MRSEVDVLVAFVFFRNGDVVKLEQKICGTIQLQLMQHFSKGQKRMRDRVMNEMYKMPSECTFHNMMITSAELDLHVVSINPRVGRT